VSLLLRFVAFFFLSVAFTQVFAETGKNILIMPRKAEGISETKPSIGVSAGLSNPSQSQNSTINYSAEYAIQPVIPFSVGLRLGVFDAPGSGSNAALTRTSLLLTGNYNFGGDIVVLKNSYVGMSAGPVLDNTNGSSTVDLGIAPRVGFDIPLGGTMQKYSLGAMADYMFVGGAKADVFSLNGVVKYWF
jgi:hypothetical protein